MNKRVNLPYTTQDLFPQAGASLSPHRGSLAQNSIIGGHEGSIAGNSYISTASSVFQDNNFIPRNKSSKLQNFKKMFKRLFKPNTLDFETAIWEMVNLIINPKKMYRSHYYKQQQQTHNGKSSYARDDPSFLILLTTFLSVSAVAWGIAYSPHIWDITKLIIYMVMIDFYLTGVVISTISWLITNRIFNGTGFSKYNANYIEWGFCFDIHCNSFLIIWCLLYILQFLLLPLIRIKKSFFALLLGNTLYFGAIGYYFVISFYGFNSLPFINNLNAYNGKGNGGANPAKTLQMIILAGILPVLAVGWLLSLGFRFNVAYSMVETYFN